MIAPLMLRSVIWLSTLAAFSTVLMPALLDLSTDALLHYTLISCFSEQFWQGDLYPRWCISANAGLGSPYMIIYYPLAYYIAALFWPLSWLGLSVAGLYIFLLWLCSAVTFVTAWLWLRGLAGERRALLAAFVYLWIPYRMEVMVSRSSYPELWLLALLPLFMLCVQQLAAQKKGAMGWLALTIAACLFTQVPTTLNMLFLGGIYIVLIRGRDWKTSLRYALSTLWAGVMAAIYLIPGVYYKQFLSDTMDFTLQNMWVARHMTLADFSERTWLMANFGLTILLLLTLAIKLRGKIADLLIKKEAAVMFACAAIALFMLTPYSLPLWEWWRATGIPGLPWRMQAFIALACVYFTALYMRWLGEKRLKTWKGDYAAAMLFMIMLCIPLNSMYSSEQKEVVARSLDARLIAFEEHFPKWTTAKSRMPETIVALNESGKDRPLAAISSGGGDIEKAAWEEGSFLLDVILKRKSTLTLQHYYYPIWQVMDAGKAVEITPDHEGKITMTLEAGEHHVTTTRAIYQGTPLLEWCRQISLAAFLLWVGWFITYRRNVSANAA